MWADTNREQKQPLGRNVQRPGVHVHLVLGFVIILPEDMIKGMRGSDLYKALICTKLSVMCTKLCTWLGLKSDDPRVVIPSTAHV